MCSKVIAPHIIQIVKNIFGSDQKNLEIYTNWIAMSVSLTSSLQLFTVLPAKSDSDVILCLQSYQGLIIDISLVY